MNKFFSKENLHTAVWAIVVGILSFIGGLIWKHYDGPDEVKIVNISDFSKKDTTLTIIRFESVETAKNEKLNSNTPVIPTNNNLKKKPTYQFNPTLLDSLIKEAAAKNGKIITAPEIKTVSSSTESEANLASLYRPQFVMPSIVSGYTDELINSYGNININKIIFSGNEFIELNISFYQKNTLDEITPLFVSILKKHSENSYTQIWSDQYKPLDNKTKVRFSAQFPPDTYELTIGFYLHQEINTKYPGFFYKRFVITIQ